MEGRRNSFREVVTWNPSPEASESHEIEIDYVEDETPPPPTAATAVAGDVRNVVSCPEKTDTMTEVADKASGEVSSCESAGYSNSSRSASGTARTRMETMDSFEAQDNGLLMPPCTSQIAEEAKANDNDFDDGASNHSRSLHVSRDSTFAPPEKPKSAIVQLAYKIHRWWYRVSHAGRGALLRGVVGLAKTSARYPWATVVGYMGVSIILIAGGFFTNFKVRLDSEVIFTPTNSEVWEHQYFLSNDRMYEGVGSEPTRRRMMGLDAMAHNPGEGFTWRELQRLNRHIELQKLEENRGLAFRRIVDAENSDTLDWTTATMVEGRSAPTISPSLTPTPAEAVAAAESSNGTATPSIKPSQSPTATPTLAPSAAVKKRTWEPGSGEIFSILVHADKLNIFTLEGMEKMWDALDSLRSSKHYGRACTGSKKTFHDFYGENTCEIRSITRFWNHNRTLYNEEVKTEEDLFNTADAAFYDDGGFVDLPFILAEMEVDENGRPVAGQAFYSWVYLKEKGTQFDLLDDLNDVRKRWEDESSENNIVYILDFASPDSFASEVMRSITGDIPLIPVVFVIMAAFTCLIFFKRDRLKSRCLLGLGAVITIFMSTLAAYGLMFMCGVPITTMTNLLIFVIFGIGLDDTFVITGAYFRTGHIKDTVERIGRVMESVGLSILITSVTTSSAFLLGAATSNILPIRWLCLYGVAAVVLDFIYQITLFIAMLALDERRIQSNRMDCCFCANVPNPEPEQAGAKTSTSSDGAPYSKEIRRQSRRPKNSGPYESDHIADRFMRWFASRLMNPVVKVIVLIAFFSFTAVCAWRTTMLKQVFNFKDLLPAGSYLTSYVTAIEYYSDRAIALRVVFRFAEQDQPEIRQQMIDYVDDLIENVDALNEAPPLFWARDFEKLVDATPEYREMPFWEALSAMLSETAIYDAYGKDIIFRSNGTIMYSQCRLYVTDLDMDNVLDQVGMMEQQRAVTARQPINQGRKLWAFFTYDLIYHIFAFYEVAAVQLTFNTICSVIVVTVMAFLLIPHWTAVPIIFPMMSALFIQMLGVLQMFGFAINVITYIVLVISIGLLVDFIMHVLMRYYESECDTREEKVKDALGTMGASILVGGLSTFLGVTPLIFSTSEVFSTVCVSFLAMVTLGVSHGLIVLPVILSYIGTEDVVRHRQRLSLIQISQALSARFHLSVEASTSRHAMDED